METLEVLLTKGFREKDMVDKPFSCETIEIGKVIEYNSFSGKATVELYKDVNFDKLFLKSKENLVSSRKQN